MLKYFYYSQSNASETGILCGHFNNRVDIDSSYILGLMEPVKEFICFTGKQYNPEHFIEGIFYVHCTDTEISKEDYEVYKVLYG